MPKLIKDKTFLIIAHRMRTVDGVDKILNNSYVIILINT